MKQCIVGAPFERIALDITGRLQETDRGIKCIQICPGNFVAWSRYGVPFQIHNDQGFQFEWNLFQELCNVLNIENTRTTPYHPQSE